MTTKNQTGTDRFKLGNDGHWVERPMGRGPTFVPNASADCYRGGWRSNDAGNGIVWDPHLENNVGGTYPPYHIGDFPDPYPNDRMTYPRQPEFFPWQAPDYPFKPIVDPAEMERRSKEFIEELTKKMAEKDYAMTRFRHRQEPDKHRAIDIVSGPYTKDELTIRVKANKISIIPYTTKDFGPLHWPEFRSMEFDIDEKTEEVVSAKIDKGVLTILIKNIFVPEPEKLVPIS
jgi:hypothetical protein